MSRFKDRKGVQKVQNCGSLATIIEYRSNCDLDVQFEDGEIVRHRTWAHFDNGSICNPKLTKTDIQTKYSRVGEKRMMNCGLEAEITAYRSALDVDIKFSDGRERTSIQYNAFKTGVAKPEIRSRR